MKMTLTKQQVILGGLMAAAVVGLSLDRLVFAAAPEEVDTAVATSAVAKAAGKVAAGRSAEAALASRLLTLTQGQSKMEPRDVFASGGAAGSGGGNASDSADRWERRTLSAVMIRSTGKSLAVVDGRVIPLGGTLDGLRLVRLEPGAAVFSDGKSELTLRSGKDAAR